MHTSFPLGDKARKNLDVPFPTQMARAVPLVIIQYWDFRRYLSFLHPYPAQPQRGGSLGARPGVLVLTPFQKPYSKALGKDEILVCNELTTMHHNAAEQADLYKHNFITPEARVDTRLMRQQDQQAVENKEVFLQIVLTVEFLAKQGLPFRGHRNDKVDFDKDDTNRGNFIATMQLLA